MLRYPAANKAVCMEQEHSPKELPFFTLWTNPVAYGDGYVTGLEPGAGFPRNRAVERKFDKEPLPID